MDDTVKQKLLQKIQKKTDLKWPQQPWSAKRSQWMTKKKKQDNRMQSCPLDDPITENEYKQQLENW